MAVNHAVVTQIVVIPDAADKHLVGHHAPLILQQLPQAFKLAVGQLQHPVAAHDGIGVQIERQVAIAQQIGVRAILVPASPENRTDFTQQHGHGERLGDVIVNPQIVAA